MLCRLVLSFVLRGFPLGEKSDARAEDRARERVARRIRQWLTGFIVSAWPEPIEPSRSRGKAAQCGHKWLWLYPSCPSFQGSGRGRRGPGALESDLDSDRENAGRCP